MNILKKWKKCKSKDPIHDIKKLTSYRSKSEQISIINGCFLELSEFNALQLVLLWENPLQYKDVLFNLIDLGGSIDKLSKAGMNSMHLFIILCYFSSAFRSTQVYQIFFELLNYGFEPSKCMYVSNKVMTYIDLLIHLQNNCNERQVLKALKKHPIRNKLVYEKLEKEHFEKILLTLLCYGVPYHYEHPFENLTWLSCEAYLKKNEIFHFYAKERMKLPLNISDKETMKRIQYILLHYHYLPKLIEKLDLGKNNIPIAFQSNTENSNFHNINFYLNSQLQFYEYLPPIHEKGQLYYFHKTFFPQLLSKKSNPFTRNTIDEETIRTLKDYVHTKNTHVFPMSELLEVNENVYIFSGQKIIDCAFSRRQSFHFIEQFFEIYHPYHQISRLHKLKQFEIKYISHIFYYETNVLKKFHQCMTFPTVTNLYKIMLYYCRKSNKYVSIMYFLMEEIFQDLACFDRLKPHITSLNDHYDALFEQYIIRFEHFDTQYMNRFVENMLIIYRYKDSYEKQS